MKYLFSRRRIPRSFAVSLALIVLPSIEAESHCPGSVASVTPRFVQHALIVIPVRTNQASPFDFMVDPGSQVTVIDPSFDYGHKLLCLDETNAMQDGVRGERIPFVSPQAAEDELPFIGRAGHLRASDGTGKQRILLQLDS